MQVNKCFVLHGHKAKPGLQAKFNSMRTERGCARRGIVSGRNWFVRLRRVAGDAIFLQVNGESKAEAPEAAAPRWQPDISFIVAQLTASSTSSHASLNRFCGSCGRRGRPAALFVF